MLNQNKRDCLVFICRVQPFHNGHEAVIKQALSLAKEVVIVVGSAFSARTIKNPFTFEERKQMIESCFPNEKQRLFVVPVGDYPYDDDKWVSAVQEIVSKTVPNAKDIGLIGHSKDQSSYYLNIFPKWKRHIEVDNIGGINATDIRNSLFGNVLDGPKLPYEVEQILMNLTIKPWWKDLQEEFNMIKNYKKSWSVAPYAPTFVTTDAVVVQSGHVLLIERGRSPGKGLWALPGGFLNQNESIEDCMIRELHEETKIKLQPQVLRGSIAETKVFDKPDRDPRGRTITHAFFIKLKDMQEFPKIKGSDDAASASWVSFADILANKDKFFNDHFHILSHFLKIG